MGDSVTNASKKGWLTSIFELGAWVGCLYSGFLAEILSRKYAIIANVGVFVVGVVVQCTAAIAGPPSILGGRFITGMPLSYPIWRGRRILINLASRSGCRFHVHHRAHL